MLNVSFVFRFIPYCSSDTWSGTLKASNKGKFAILSMSGVLLTRHQLKAKVNFEYFLFVISITSVGNAPFSADGGFDLLS